MGPRVLVHTCFCLPNGGEGGNPPPPLVLLGLGFLGFFFFFFGRVGGGGGGGVVLGFVPGVGCLKKGGPRPVFLFFFFFFGFVTGVLGEIVFRGFEPCTTTKNPQSFFPPRGCSPPPIVVFSLVGPFSFHPKKKNQRVWRGKPRFLTPQTTRFF